jgi:hypothetical protein
LLLLFVSAQSAPSATSQSILARELTANIYGWRKRRGC